MIVNICGIPHKVVECEDKFNIDCHFGQIDFKACEIRINKDMTDANKKETIYKTVYKYKVVLSLGDLIL